MDFRIPSAILEQSPMTLQQYIGSIREGLLSGNTVPIRIPDFDLETVKRVSTALGLVYLSESESSGNVCMANSGEVRPEYRQAFSPRDLLDYSYAVHHSKAYRDKYQGIPKAVFSPIHPPGDVASFWKLVALGSRLRRLHHLQSPLFERITPGFPAEGDNRVTEPRFTRAIPGTDDEVAPIIEKNNNEAVIPSETGRIYINDSQYFDHVSEQAWQLFLGGNQPAQKWLKDRIGSKVELNEILHYQKIIAAMTETERLMKEIDGLEMGYDGLRFTRE